MAAILTRLQLRTHEMILAGGYGRKRSTKQQSESREIEFPQG
jgi:hypothetical protein